MNGYVDYEDEATAASQVPAVTQSAFIPKTTAFDWRNPTAGMSTVANEFQTKPSVSTSLTTRPGTDGATKPWYQDGEAMSGYAGLASSLLQAAALPGQMKLAKLQRQGLQQNLNQAKADSALKATARANLNAPRTNSGAL